MVLRLTVASLLIAYVGEIAALEEVDKLAHSLIRAAMRIWTRMLIRDAPAQDFNI